MNYNKKAKYLIKKFGNKAPFVIDEIIKEIKVAVIGHGNIGKELDNRLHNQSPDKLADEILKKHFIMSPYVKDSIEMGKGILYHDEQVIKAMQEYHRRMSEIEFNKNVEEYSFYMNDWDAHKDNPLSFLKWLERRNNKL